MSISSGEGAGGGGARGGGAGGRDKQDRGGVSGEEADKETEEELGGEE